MFTQTSVHNYKDHQPNGHLMGHDMLGLCWYYKIQNILSMEIILAELGDLPVNPKYTYNLSSPLIDNFEYYTSKSKCCPLCNLTSKS